MFHHLHELDDIPARLQKRDQGREEGREEGLESGVEIGVDKSIRQTARNLLQMNMVSDRQIAEAAGLTVAEVKPLRREWIGFAYSAKSQYGLLVFQPQSPYPTL